MIDEIIDALIAIGNHKVVVNMCEPNIMQPMKLETWMVKRTLVALDLFQDEWGKSKEQE